MNLVIRINRALDYIEDNLDGDIDLNYASKLAFCSLNTFSNMFGVITGIQLNEYIRRRRLSLAALELQNSNAKIIDIAMKYGYSSPTARNLRQNLIFSKRGAERSIGTVYGFRRAGISIFHCRRDHRYGA